MKKSSQIIVETEIPYHTYEWIIWTAFPKGRDIAMRALVGEVIENCISDKAWSRNPEEYLGQVLAGLRERCENAKYHNPARWYAILRTLEHIEFEGATEAFSQEMGSREVAF